jgi:hypothetical protein
MGELLCDYGSKFLLYLKTPFPLLFLDAFDYLECLPPFILMLSLITFTALLGLALFLKLFMFYLIISVYLSKLLSLFLAMNM